MPAITTAFTSDHRHCDQLFADAEEQASGGNWEAAIDNYRKFHQALLHHFDIEEQELFPAIEQQTGSSNGPTTVMRAEHQQVRRLAEDLGQAFADNNRERALGLCETMMLLMQQHNMKEERILYPMADQFVGDPSAILERMDAA